MKTKTLLIFILSLSVNVNAQFWQKMRGPVGAIRAIAFDPTGNAYVGADGSYAVYQSNNNGDSWSPLSTSGLPQNNVAALLYTSGGQLLAGISGNGVYSYNGSSWVSMNAGLPGNPNIRSLVETPGNNIYVSVFNGIYKWNGAQWVGQNSGLTSTQVANLAYKSDGTLLAATWDVGVLVLNGPNWVPMNNGFGAQQMLVRGIGIDNTDGIFVTAGGSVWWYDTNTSTWLLRSTGLPVSQTAMAMNKDGSGGMLVSITNRGNNGLGDGLTNIYSSSNNGVTWSQLTSGINLSQINIIRVNNAGDIFAGLNGVFRSTNNGVSWAEKDSGIDATARFNYWVKSSNASTVDNAGVMYYGTSQGIFRSTNGGTNWSLATKGMDNTNIMTVAAIGNVLLAGTYGGTVRLYRSVDQGNNWTITPATANTGFYSICANNLGRTFAGGIYSPTVQYSSDTGLTWTASSLSAGWCSLATNSQGHIFAGTETSGVQRSKDNGVTWAPMGYAQATGLGNIYSLGVNKADLLVAATSANSGNEFMFQSSADSITSFINYPQWNIVQTVLCDTFGGDTYFGDTNGIHKAGTILNSQMNFTTDNSGINGNLNCHQLFFDRQGYLWSSILDVNTSIASLYRSAQPVQPTSTAVLSTNEHLKQWTLYPNPGSGVFTLKNNDKTAQGRFYITDIMASRVMEGTISETLTEIDLQGLQHGIYFLTMETSTGTVTGKIILTGN